MTTAEVRRYDVREHSDVVITASPATAFAMQADGHVSVTHVGHERYEVRARHKVGVLRYDDIELRVAPKISIARVLWLASFHADPSHWNEVETLLDEAADPFSAIAEALTWFSETALRPTPVQGYATYEQTKQHLRGRVMFDRQMARRAGVLLPVELRFDEYDLNTVENQFLKAAIGVIRRACRDPLINIRLAHLGHRLDSVVPWTLGVPVPPIRLTRINRRYGPALALARVVLEQRSLEFPSPRQHGMSFLLNMNRVFEAFLENRLGGALEAIDGRVENQYTTHLDYDDEILMKPDLTWWRRGSCVAVMDAKYKRIVDKKYPNADAYQMLAYCTSLGIPRGYLVYADLDGKRQRAQVVRNAEVEIIAVGVDISGEIASIHAAVNDLASRIEDDISLSDELDRKLGVVETAEVA